MTQALIPLADQSARGLNQKVNVKWKAIIIGSILTLGIGLLGAWFFRGTLRYFFEPVFYHGKMTVFLRDLVFPSIPLFASLAGILEALTRKQVPFEWRAPVVIFGERHRWWEFWEGLTFTVPYFFEAEPVDCQLRQINTLIVNVFTVDNILLKTLQVDGLARITDPFLSLGVKQVFSAKDSRGIIELVVGSAVRSRIAGGEGDGIPIDKISAQKPETLEHLAQACRETSQLMGVGIPKIYLNEVDPPAEMVAAMLRKRKAEFEGAGLQIESDILVDKIMAKARKELPELTPHDLTTLALGMVGRGNVQVINLGQPADATMKVAALLAQAINPPRPN